MASGNPTRGLRGMGMKPQQLALRGRDYRSNPITIIVAEDGSLHSGEPSAELGTSPARADSGGDGLGVNALRRAWITSHVGIQVFDAMGRLGGVVSRAQGKGTVNCAFAGPNREWLYVCSSDRVCRRRILIAGR